MLHDDEHFWQRYLRRGKRVFCETLMTTLGDMARAAALLRGQWDWWEHGHAANFRTNQDGSTDQVLVPVSWYRGQIRLHILPPVELPAKGGWRLPVNMASSFEGPASFDIYPNDGADELMIRGRFHGVLEHIPTAPHEWVTLSHLHAESGTLHFPFPHGTGWMGLRRRLEAEAPVTSHQRAS